MAATEQHWAKATRKLSAGIVGLDWEKNSIATYCYGSDRKGDLHVVVGRRPSVATCRTRGSSHTGLGIYSSRYLKEPVTTGTSCQHLLSCPMASSSLLCTYVVESQVKQLSGSSWHTFMHISLVSNAEFSA